jgi:hypothetical protein
MSVKSCSAEAGLEALEGAPPAVIECGVLDCLQEGAVVVVELVADDRRLGSEVYFDDPGHHQVRRAAEPDLAGFRKGF